MTNKLLLVVLLFFGTTVLSFAQSPQAFNYQGVARDVGGNVLSAQNISLQIDIRQGTESGTIVLSEIHNETTSQLGLFNLQIGAGSPVLGSVSSIDWSDGPYFIEVSIDPSGGSNFQTLGISQLLSIPYALYAETSGDSGIPGPTGPTGPPGVLASGTMAGNTPYWSGSEWALNSNNLYNDGDGIGIGTAGPPASSAKFEIESTDRGVLIPRLTLVQRDAIANPETGLMIFQTDNSPGFYYFNGSGWVGVLSSSNQSTTNTLLYTIDGF